MPLSAYDNIPLELRDLKQWICWRYAARKSADERPTKIPINPRTLRAASSTNPEDWGSFAEAEQGAARPGISGIGFIFVAGGGIVGVDFDECFKDGEIVPAIKSLLPLFNTYVEKSPSKTGLHIILKGIKPHNKCAWPNVLDCKKVEVYEHGRYFAFTGDSLGEPRPLNLCQAAIESLFALLPPPDPVAAPAPAPDPAPLQASARPPRKPVGGIAKARYMAYLKKLPEAISGSGGHAATLRAACDGFRFSLSPADVLEGMQWYNDNKTGGEKWTRAELQHKIDSALKLVTDKNEFGKLLDVKQDVTKPEKADLIPLGERDSGGALVLSPSKTLPTAEAYVKEFHTIDNLPSIVCYANQLFFWKDNHYKIVSDSAVRSTLQPWLHNAKKYVLNPGTKEPELHPFESNDKTIISALRSIRDYTHVSDEITPPAWLRPSPGDHNPLEIMICKSNSIHIPTRSVIKPTPRLFATAALEFDYVPSAKSPARWLRFLSELWPCDPQSVEALQDWFGYILTQDTRQQKMLLMVGPKRSGKGTIGRVLGRLIGRNNVAGPTTGSLAGEFGLEQLIGKSLAIVSDARFSGDNISIVAERLLCISGEDSLSINRKNKSFAHNMRLPTRFMFFSNEIPRLTDASGALAGRFVILRLTKSFYGAEDHGLEDAILEELPGILLWAMAGWERLRQRGRFIQPASVADVIEDLEDLSSPVGAFIKECCELGPGFRVWCDDLYLAWQGWCARDGRTVKSTKQTFGRDLSAVMPGILRKRASGNISFYEGINIRG